MFGECHAHIIMDGANYKEAIAIHKNEIQEDVIRKNLSLYKERGICFIRDGGDALGVSQRAKEIALEYGIDYRTPVFAIHKKGHYGSIVGISFENMKEYHMLVLKAKHKGADFIKIMTTGLLDFKNQGEITGVPLDKEEVKEMVHIAHEEGMAVMSHTNGDYGVQSALEAGVDSIEHGNYMSEESVKLFAQSDTVWVPTLVPIRNLRNCNRYAEEILKPVIEQGEKTLIKAFECGVKIAPGSDAGAYMVPHGDGLLDEIEAYKEILGDEPALYKRLHKGQEEIERKFKYASSQT